MIEITKSYMSRQENWQISALLMDSTGNEVS